MPAAMAAKQAEVEKDEVNAGTWVNEASNANDCVERRVCDRVSSVEDDCNSRSVLLKHGRVALVRGGAWPAPTPVPVPGAAGAAGASALVLVWVSRAVWRVLLTRPWQFQQVAERVTAAGAVAPDRHHTASPPVIRPALAWGDIK